MAESSPRVELGGATRISGAKTTRAPARARARESGSAWERGRVTATTRPARGRGTVLFYNRRGPLFKRGFDARRAPRLARREDLVSPGEIAFHELSVREGV